MGWIFRLTVFIMCVACQITVGSALQSTEIEKLHITSDIAFRYATTNVTSELVNRAKTAQEVTFKVTLPPAAFISSFSMIIDGVQYDGEVKEKEAARKQYEKAKRKGQSAGQVASKSLKESNNFKINVNVAAEDRVRFTLLYDELLKRRLGLYEHVININPGQPVRDLKVKVNIVESRKLTILNVPEILPLHENIVFPTENPLAVITRPRPNEAIISYSPSVSQQRENTVDGISGRFVVQYDIERKLDGGEIQVVDGYFVHYFAPGGLEAVDKNIVFILDTSGSMQGKKISQTKDAMDTILEDLRSGDAFNVLTFAAGVNEWRENGMVHADASSIQAAKHYVSTLEASGGTNINDALLRGVNQLRRQAAGDVEPRPALIIFLTDGQDSTGTTTNDQILKNMKQANTDGYSLFTLGFGSDVDFPFLTKLAVQNDGIARRIYTDSDAALQLESFYEEVSTPVMSDVKIRYLASSVDIDSVTTTDFNNLFEGTEIVIAGKLADNSVNNVISQVSGHSSKGYMEMDLKANVARVENRLRNLDLTHLTERLWAYLTIKKLLETIIEFSDEVVQQNAKNKALELSLKYSFVTPLTSMVVTKPDITDEVDDETQKDLPTTNPPNSPTGRSTMKLAKKSRGKSFVDNDPHFVVDLDGINERLCFDVNGHPGDVFQILYDPLNDLTVNAEVLSPAVVHHEAKHIPTYISKIAVIHSSVTIVIHPKRAIIQDKVVQWKPINNKTIEDIQLSFPTTRHAVIQIGSNIKLIILRHLSRIPSPKKIDYLGFYVESGDGLSDFCHGLLGQFQTMRARFLDDSQVKEKTEIKPTRTLELSTAFNSKHTLLVHLGKRRNMNIKEHIPCWHIRNNGRGLIQGRVKDYIVPTLTQRYYSLNKSVDSR